MPIPFAILFIFVLFKHAFYRNNCRLQRDSNSDHWSRGRARWPLDHHHGQARHTLLTIKLVRNKNHFLLFWSLVISCWELKLKKNVRDKNWRINWLANIYIKSITHRLGYQVRFSLKNKIVYLHISFSIQNCILYNTYSTSENNSSIKY